MNVQKLNLSNYRNFETASFSFHPDTIHVLWGKNAQGKSNLIESIYFLSHLRSWRTSKTVSLINHGQEAFCLECTVENKGRLEVLKTVFSSGKKAVFRNGKPVKSFSNFVGILNAVLFSPDDLTLFSAPPKERRHFLDRELVKLSRSYTRTLSQFNALLKERNVLLKGHSNDALLQAVTSQMIEQESILIAQRSQFLDLLEEKAKEIYPILCENAEEDLSLSYQTCVDPRKNIKEQLEQLYAQTLAKDKQMHITTAGVHKDDLVFCLNRKPVTQTASQGQKRSIMLALKIGLCKTIQEKGGQNPILLLDDVFSELDPQRRQGLIASFPEEMQIFITTAETVSPSWFKRPVCFYTVDHGVMKEGIYDI